MIKTCTICGLGFARYRPTSIICSPECRRENASEQKKERYAANRERILAQVKPWRMADGSYY
jgi:hypothetical protein